MRNQRKFLVISLAANVFFLALIVGGNFHHHFGRLHGMHPPGIPLFSPHDLFTHEEMETDFAEMKKHFQETKKMREDFSMRLQKGPISKEEVLSYFDDMEKPMNDLRDALQSKAAIKISGMTDQQRQEFAKRISEY